MWVCVLWFYVVFLVGFSFGVMAVFVSLVGAVCLFDSVEVVGVAPWVGLIPLFSITFSSSHQLTIIVVAFIVVPPSSCPTWILVAYARILGIMSRALQNTFLSSHDSKLMRIQLKCGVPFCLSTMSMWCGCDDIAGSFAPPVIAVFIAFAIAFTFRLRSPPNPSMFWDDVPSGQTSIEKATAAFLSSSCPFTMLVIKSIPGESSFESDICFPEVWEMGLWVGL